MSNSDSRRNTVLLVSVVVVVALGVYAFRLGIAGGLMPGAQEGILLPEITPYRVLFELGEPGAIVVHILNTGPVDTSVALVQLAGSQPLSIRSFTIEPSERLPRLATATIRIPYNWIPGDPYTVKIITEDGASFFAEVAAAVASPSVQETIPLAILLGAYVGVIPVYLGIAPLPFFRKLEVGWLDFLNAFAVGVLVFLLVDTVAEGKEVAFRLPIHLGPLIFATGFTMGLLVLVFFGRHVWRRWSALQDSGRLNLQRGVFLATMIALGIGLHNLGEGLAIGAAYTQGLFAFATFLAVGFGVHNLSEGVAIISPITSHRALAVRYPLIWGLIAGVPTILGAVIGFTVYSDAAATLFFAVASASILYVIAEVLIEVATKPEASNNPKNYAGLLAGIFVMYATAVLLQTLVGGI